MKSYVIGDVQGCYVELLHLIKKIKFNVKNDKLIFTGDLVNRGAQSLSVLRFVKSLGKSAKIVLGNHDLYLLAVAYGYLLTSKKDTLNAILNAPDKEELIHWLRQQNFLYSYKQHIITHSGIPPVWSLKKAKCLASELESVLKEDISFQLFMSNLFGNKPDLWHNDLKAVNRWRCIANYLTRMRLCDQKGQLDFSYKGKLENKPIGLDAWFNFPNTKINPKYTLVFGHWAALNGVTNKTQCLALDTGCVWGRKLSAYCIETKKLYQVDTINLIKEIK